MSQQKDLLREMAAAINSSASDSISDWFTEGRAPRPCRRDMRGPAK